jgi:predicted RNase H-like HicB family nuclease
MVGSMLHLALALPSMDYMPLLRRSLPDSLFGGGEIHAVCLTSRRSQPPLALSVPLSRFTPRVGGGSAFFVRHHSHVGMKRRFTVVIEKKHGEYEARCRELPDVVAHGSSKQDTLEKIRAAITKKLGDDLDGGSAPTPHPVSPSPRGPIIVEESHEKPDA